MLEENSQPTELSHGTLLSTPPASHTTDHHQWVNNKAIFIYTKGLQAITLSEQYTHTQDTVQISEAVEFAKEEIIYCILSNKDQRSPRPKDINSSCRM